MAQTQAVDMKFTVDELFQHCVDGVFVIDRDRRFVGFSDACERITGQQRASVIGAQCPCTELNDCGDQYGRSIIGALCPSLQVFKGDFSSPRQRKSIQHRDGHCVKVDVTYSPIPDEQGEVSSVVGIMREAIATNGRDGEVREPAGFYGPGIQEEHVGPLEDMNQRPLQACGQPSDTETPSGSLDQILTTIEKREILGALRRSNGQRTLAARLLGISRSRLYRRMEALGIDPRHLGTGEVV